MSRRTKRNEESREEKKRKKKRGREQEYYARYFSQCNPERSVSATLPITYEKRKTKQTRKPPLRWHWPRFSDALRPNRPQTYT